MSNLNATSTTFDITGMTCAACAGRVERALKAVPGVLDAQVNLPLERANLRIMPGADQRRLVAAVEAAGYGAIPRGDTVAQRHDAHTKAQAWQVRHLLLMYLLLILAIILTLPFLAQMLVMALGGPNFLPGKFQAALAAPVLLIAGSGFFRGAWKAALRLDATMDTLVALGTGAAYLFSLGQLVRHGDMGGHLYFESAAIVITMVLLGKVLEARAARSAAASLTALMQLAPPLAQVLLPDGTEREVSVESVMPGQSVIVRPAGRIPVDGLVLQGKSECDESLITGESTAIVKAPGDKVIAGSLNSTGQLVIEARAIGEDTTLARIARMVEAAQSGKAPVQALVDRIARIFVPAVLAIAAATFLAWLAFGATFETALIAAVSVLVVSCPCALGLATPAALVAGTGAAARLGIVVKDVRSLEAAAQVDIVIFDKTGTLTEGRPRLTSLIPMAGQDEAHVLALAAGLQSASEHPLAKAVLDAARERGIAPVDLADFRAIPGCGVEGTYRGARLRLGTAAWLKTAGVQIPPAGGAVGTQAILAQDGQVLGIFDFADTPRPHAAEAISTLKRKGIRTAMLSGDTPQSVAALARTLGLDDARGGVLPADKAGTVQAFRQNGHYVAMIGDGVNDTPALAAADLGIAMGGGVDAALEIAGMSLMRADLRLVPEALDLAKATVRKIRENLFFAFIYNVIGIPLAAFGLLTPGLAGAAMAASSVCVVTNALLLARRKVEL